MPNPIYKTYTTRLV